MEELQASKHGWMECAEQSHRNPGPRSYICSHSPAVPGARASTGFPACGESQPDSDTRVERGKGNHTIPVRAPWDRTLVVM